MAEVSQPAASTAEIGLSLLRFDYAEFNDDGSTLDRELGGIPGWSFKFSQHYPDWEWEGLASYHQGRVDYTGQTQAGVPHNTNTDEEVVDVALRMGRWFEGSYPVMPYAGLGYRRWNRDILSTSSVGGLFESYRWKYAWLGAKIIAYQQGASNLMLDIGWIRPLSPVMFVDFKGAYNISPNLYPESRNGLRLMLTSRSEIRENTALIVEPYYEYWKLGKSPTVVTGGIPVCEPASKTKNFGVNLRLGRRF